MIRRDTSKTAVACIAAALLAMGCASVDFATEGSTTGKLPRPNRVLVHDFAATPADLPGWSEARANFSGPQETPSAEDLQAGRELGALVASELVAKIEAMGMTAARARGQRAEVNDLAIVGYFASMDEGSVGKRLVIGFGSGAPELETHAEGYRMTDSGYERVGSGATASKSAKTPGMVVPALVTVATSNPVGLVVGGGVKAAGELTGSATIEGTAKRTAESIAEVLEQRFREQGWI